MEHVIFVPAIYHVDEISQLASFLSFIESRITVKDKKLFYTYIRIDKWKIRISIS